VLANCAGHIRIYSKEQSDLQPIYERIFSITKRSMEDNGSCRGAPEKVLTGILKELALEELEELKKLRPGG
jgi:hypothetical protein